MKSIMGLIVEENELPKVIDVSGYDLTKVVLPETQIVTYPINFYFENSSKTTAILHENYVYFFVDNGIVKNIYKQDKSVFENFLKDKQSMPNPIEVINAPWDSKDKPTEIYKKLSKLIENAQTTSNKNIKIDLNGVPKIDLVSTMSGQTYIFDIWATFCGPCKKKINEVLTPLQQEFSTSGLSFFYYSVDTDIVKLKEYVEKNINYGTHVFDNRGFQSEIITKYNIQGIPKTFLVDKDGNLFDLPSDITEAKKLVSEKI